MKPFPVIAALILGASVAGAQQFIAPSGQSVSAGSELSHGSDATQLLWVRNASTIPIIVYGVTLFSCENIKQFCGGERLNVLVPPGQQRTVFRVTPSSSERSSDFRWRYVYHADSTDLKAMELLRANTPSMEPPPTRVVSQMPPSIPVPVDPSVPGVDKPVSREPLTAEERANRISMARPGEDTTPDIRMKFKVFYGSVLGSTMMPGAPIQMTGPCINPAEAAAYEKDVKIAKTPWRPPVLTPSFARLHLPIELKDSTLKSNDVLVRFAVDTTGEAIPGSTSILESPHGLVSVAACQATIAAHATPAKDKAGKLTRAWVQMPLKVGF